MPTNRVNLLDVNPLERITGDVAISQFNYESILNGLVQWDQSHNDKITIRLATRTDPYFVDYTIPTKYFYDKNYGTINSAVLLAADNFAYKNRMKMTVSSGDPVTLRINAVDAGNTQWQLYKDVTVYNEVVEEPYSEPIEGSDQEETLDNVWFIKRSTEFKYEYDQEGLYFRMYDPSDPITKKFVIYKTLTKIPAESPIEGEVDGFLYATINSVSTKVARRMCIETTSTKPLYPAEIVPEFYYSHLANTSSSGVVYSRLLNKEIDGTQPFSSFTSGYKLFCSSYKLDAAYKEGDIVYYLGDFYISLVDAPQFPPCIITSTTLRSDYDVYEEHPDIWARVLVMPLNNSKISSSGVLRVTADTDLNGFVLRNVGRNESSEKTSVSIMGTIAIPGNESEQATGMNIIQTSNYANWPEFSTTKWMEGTSYQTNSSLSSFDKQDYSAVMVFKHFGDDEHYRYKNIINYDGPDVDQGLCILLPVTITDENNVTHDPADGSIIDFLFNIWPNHKYDGRSVNDLIINKSQIYVYSVPDYGEYKTNGFNAHTVEPIAKFSMARLVNFYMFSENVGVPDRPSVYKARFIYSKKEKRWKTYDYYQFPDHIFLSPHGFVDPSDPKAYSVQTAGFPLFQNPFSDFDLSAIHIDPTTYRNQLQNKDIPEED